MSGSKLRGGNNDSEQSENPRKRTKSTPSTPISCVVCDRVFFDNVSLCLHFLESHYLKETPSLSYHIGEIPSLSHHCKSAESLQRGNLFSQSSSSRVSRTSEVGHVESPSMNDFSRASSLPVCYVASPNVLPETNSIPPLRARICAPGLATLPTLPLHLVNRSLPIRSVESPNVLPKHVNLVQSPVTNSMAPLGARNGLARLPTLPLNVSNGSLPVHSVETPNVLPEQVNPMQLPVANSIPPLRSRSSDPGLATLPTLPLNVTNGGKGPSSVKGSSRNRKFASPSQEIIVISDDEDDQIDLTLRL